MARYNPDKMAEEIAQKVLDEYVYEGKTLREWVSRIKAIDEGEQVSPLRSAPVEMTTRLLTLEEALSVKGCGWEEIWFDADEEEGTAEYKECFECVFIGGHGADRDGAVIEINPEKYNKAHHHRLWLGEEKPTDAQREAEKWDE